MAEMWMEIVTCLCTDNTKRHTRVVRGRKHQRWGQQDERRAVFTLFFSRKICGVIYSLRWTHWSEGTFTIKARCKWITICTPLLSQWKKNKRFFSDSLQFILELWGVLKYLSWPQYVSETCDLSLLYQHENCHLADPHVCLHFAFTILSSALSMLLAAVMTTGSQQTLLWVCGSPRIWRESWLSFHQHLPPIKNNGAEAAGEKSLSYKKLTWVAQAQGAQLFCCCHLATGTAE